MKRDDFGEVIGKRLPDDPEPRTPEEQEIYESMERQIRLHPPPPEQRARYEAMKREADWHRPEYLDE